MRIGYATALVSAIAVVTLGEYEMPVNPYDKQGTAPALSRPVAVVESRKGPWLDNQAWGSGFVGTMPVTEGIETPVFSAEEIPGPPRVQTIILGRDITTPPGTNADFRARVRYTIGSTSNDFLCDWGRGMQIPITANWVRVTALTFRPDGRVAYNAGGGSVSITAGIAEGALTSGVPATLTEATVQIAAGGGVAQFSIPEFAKRVIVSSPAVIATPTNVEIMARYAAISGALYRFEDQLMNGFLLPGATSFLQITNNNAAIQSFTVQWILGL